MKAFQAYGTAGRVTAETPQSAANEYFSRFPSSRKCSVIEGEADGHFFTVRYGRASEGDWPFSAKDITKKAIHTLPHEVQS